MAWETVTISGIPLRESQTAGLGDGSLSISGREMSDIASAAHVQAVHTDLPQLLGRVVPVVLEGKSHLTGYYRVDAATSSLQRFAAGDLLIAVWSMDLTRLGAAADVEFESRVPTIARSSEVAGTASFWHAPPVGTVDYFTGGTSPAGSTVRSGADGAVTVYRGIPNGVLPRWTVAAGDYLLGSARIVLDGVRRVGTDTPPHATWQVDNGLVRVASDGAGITVSAWSSAGSAWVSAKSWRFYAAASLTAAPEMTILWNSPEECRLRLSFAATPGRVTVDLSLRRGSRFVTGVFKRHSAAYLSVFSPTESPSSAATGGLRQATADASGNRFVAGSSRTVESASVPAGALEKSAVTQLDFFLGHEVGATPASGDAFADLFAQFLGTQNENVRAVRR